VLQDPARPYVLNDEFRVTGRQPTAELADLNNPILQPGRGMSCASATCLYSPESRFTPLARVCWPVGHAVAYWAFAQAAMSGLLAALRARQDADRSVGKVAAFLMLPQ
jgi:hypothetical protein